MCSYILFFRLFYHPITILMKQNTTSPLNLTDRWEVGNRTASLEHVLINGYRCAVSALDASKSLDPDQTETFCQHRFRPTNRNISEWSILNKWSFSLRQMTHRTVNEFYYWQLRSRRSSPSWLERSPHSLCWPSYTRPSYLSLYI